MAARSGEGLPPREVKAFRVQARPIERVVLVTGALAAQEQATISAKVPGRLQSIMVDLGSKVRRNQMIAQLERQDYELRLKQTEAALAQARARLGLSPSGKDELVEPEQTGTVRQARALLDEATLRHERSKGLFGKGLISKAELDATEASYKVALSRHQDAIEEIRNRQALLVQRRSELEIARQQLSDTSILAPFDGVVQERRAALGEYLSAAAPLVTIVRMDPLRLRAEVPEREAHNVREGQYVRVTVEGDSAVYTGRISRLSPSITAQNRMLMVEAEVRNEGSLRPGSFAKAEIISEEGGTSPVVPTSAIVAFAGIEKVILIEEGKAVERPITVGRRTADWAEVVSGVSVGELIVSEPGNLQTGQPVVVVE